MRKLILTRGAPASGKSTFINNYDDELKLNTISPDELRILMAGLTVDDNDKKVISQARDKAVWKQVYEILEMRMGRGLTTCIDATHKRTKDFGRYLELAKKYHYEVIVLDFHKNADIGTLLERNSKRGYKKVPDDVVINSHAIIENNTLSLPKNVKHVTEGHGMALSLFLNDYIEVLSKDDYEQIKFIGDIHGSADVLKKALMPLDTKTLYVFVGDFHDRGTQEGEVLEIMADLAPRKNVRLIAGNHERHLMNAIYDLPIYSREFRDRTLPELQKVSKWKKKALTVCNKLQDALVLRYEDKNIVVTHAGIVDPNRLNAYRSTYDCMQGTGSYEYNVDKAFKFNEHDESWYQVHGHRNKKNYETIGTDKGDCSINLEQKVEFGGKLGVVTYDTIQGFVDESVENDNYRSKYTNHDNHFKNQTPWSHQLQQIDEATMEEIEKHEYIHIKNVSNGIRSVSHSTTAFYEGNWDKINTKCRGMFINDNNHIVARSYDKFFNIDERESTKREELAKKFDDGVTLDEYIKYNGFLGIIGYDEITDSIQICSKTRNDMQFVDYFKDAIDKEQFDVELFKEYCKVNKCSLIFEVEHPEDVHIVRPTYYPKATLLDIVERDIKFNKVPYELLLKIAKELNIKRVKEKVGSRITKKEFLNQCKLELDTPYTKGNDGSKNCNYMHNDFLEGYILEFSDGTIVKLKRREYQIWKCVRTQIDSILKQRDIDPENDGEVKLYDHLPEVNEITQFATLQATNDLLELYKFRELYLDKPTYDY